MDMDTCPRCGGKAFPKHDTRTSWSCDPCFLWYYRWSVDIPMSTTKYPESAAEVQGHLDRLDKSAKRNTKEQKR